MAAPQDKHAKTQRSPRRLGVLAVPRLNALRKDYEGAR
jgi:hypothetical protein